MTDEQWWDWALKLYWSSQDFLDLNEVFNKASFIPGDILVERGSNKKWHYRVDKINPDNGDYALESKRADDVEWPVQLPPYTPAWYSRDFAENNYVLLNEVQHSNMGCNHEWVEYNSGWRVTEYCKKCNINKP